MDIRKTRGDQGRAQLSGKVVSPHDSAAHRTMVTDALARLSSENRTLLHRAYYYGWSTGQIAANLGIAEGSVKTQLHYALRTLQHTLRDMGAAL